MTTATRPEGFSLNAFGRRFGLALIVIVVSTLLLTVLGVPGAIVRAISFGAGMTVVFAGVYPPETPHRTRKNATSWVAHLVLFGGGMLLVSWWRGV